MHKLFHTFRRVPRLFYHTRRRSPSELLHRYSHKKGEDTRRLKAERADIFVSWKIFPVEEEWCEDERTKRKVGHWLVVARGWRGIYTGRDSRFSPPVHVVYELCRSNSGERCWTNERRTKEDTKAKGGRGNGERREGWTVMYRIRNTVHASIVCTASREGSSPLLSRLALAPRN